MGASEAILRSLQDTSWIRRMFEEGLRRKERFGTENVFDLSLGNPDLEPPTAFKEALAAQAADLSERLHAYMPNAGYPHVREAVAEHLRRTQGPPFTAGDVVMTVGASGALNIILKTILEPGEEVIIPRPYFLEYNNYLEAHRGVPRPADTAPDFSLDLDHIAAAASPHTRAVLINTPNNPTGRVYTAEQLRGLGELLRDLSRERARPVFLISDEPYRRICYTAQPPPSVFAAWENTFVVTSFSKDLSIPGERIGYAALHPEMGGKEEIAAGMVMCMRNLGYVNAPALMQHLVPEMLSLSVDVAIYRRRRDRLCEALSAAGYTFPAPEGAFYLFPEAPGGDDADFAEALQEENVLVVPGRAFEGPGHFRIAYCVPDAVIEGALPAFRKVRDHILARD